VSYDTEWIESHISIREHSLNINIIGFCRTRTATADLVLEVGTDNVDVVGLRSTSPNIARRFLSHGIFTERQNNI
jgi:hypothetical protein